MADFTIIAHIELPSKSEPVKSGPIRLQVPAESELEAKAKAERYIQHKLAVVFDSCEVQRLSRPLTSDEKMADILKGFQDIFGPKS
jgi:hypothetical protein